jgi:hypothetical protein
MSWAETSGWVQMVYVPPDLLELEGWVSGFSRGLKQIVYHRIKNGNVAATIHT